MYGYVIKREGDHRHLQKAGAFRKNSIEVDEASLDKQY